MVFSASRRKIDQCVGIDARAAVAGQIQHIPPKLGRNEISFGPFSDPNRQHPQTTRQRVAPARPGVAKSPEAVDETSAHAGLVHSVPDKINTQQRFEKIENWYTLSLTRLGTKCTSGFTGLRMDVDMAGYYQKYDVFGEPLSSAMERPLSPRALTDAEVEEKILKQLVDVVELECAFELQRGLPPDYVDQED